VSTPVDEVLDALRPLCPTKDAADEALKRLETIAVLRADWSARAVIQTARLRLMRIEIWP
jgi:hypothetical protein